MRHQKHKSKLGVKGPHRAAMLSNLAAGLVENGKIKTTAARARALRSYVEKLVTKAKTDTVTTVSYTHLTLPTICSV